MTAPTPAQLAGQVDQLVRLADGLRDPYRWLHDSAYTRRRGGHPGSSSGDEQDLSTLLVGTTPLRDEVSAVGDDVAHALATLRKAAQRIRSIERVIDRGRDRTLPPSSERQLPRTVTKDELKAARKAKQDRAGRGEGWGAA